MKLFSFSAGQASGEDAEIFPAGESDKRKTQNQPAKLLRKAAILPYSACFFASPDGWHLRTQDIFHLPYLLSQKPDNRNLHPFLFLCMDHKVGTILCPVSKSFKILYRFFWDSGSRIYASNPDADRNRRILRSVKVDSLDFTRITARWTDQKPEEAFLLLLPQTQ